MRTELSLPGACTDQPFYISVWLGAGPESYDAWNWQNEQLDEPILQMSNLNGLQDKAKQRLRSMAKDYYFKNGGFDKSNFNNVTDVSYCKLNFLLLSKINMEL